MHDFGNGSSDKLFCTDLIWFPGKMSLSHGWGTREFLKWNVSRLNCFWWNGSLGTQELEGSNSGTRRRRHSRRLTFGMLYNSIFTIWLTIYILTVLSRGRWSSIRSQGRQLSIRNRHRQFGLSVRSWLSMRSRGGQLSGQSQGRWLSIYSKGGRQRLSVLALSLSTG